MRTLARSARRFCSLAPGAAVLAAGLALVAQLYFSRGPQSIREGLTLTLLAVACFIVADWLHARRPRGDAAAPESAARTAPRPAAAAPQRRELPPADDDFAP